MRHALLALALALVAGVAGAAPAYPTGDLSLGKPKAKIHVEEYASLSCSHCAHFNNEVFPAFKAKYIDTGKVRYTLHEFLTEPANVAAIGFITARCAGADKYFAVVDGLFRRQAEIFETRDLRPVLLEVAKSAGLSEAQVTACVSNPANGEALDARVAAGEARGVDSTPFFFVNGVKVDGVTLADLDKAIAAAGKAKPAKKK
ncbi:MAG: DsbA family protein [Phenylobacterium sp.]|uniref:thioredoxin domain-containing protein n=1 Tax=Phenylobacterium sp. TaxID=1871053 RepID=UPI001B3D56C7|nr:thioredoxin domain-containing protein [Phenylobacterium sp.]MBP7817666.1 DsbA family protein [Phenylobacterium sp.]MBP9230296.1 DsbA family protein [Phenylobacterium sp.]MBP9754147.1 DsbA family protein [Phenylobacterium sp.]